MDTNTLSNLKNTALGILTHARVQLLNNHPFIGNIAMGLEIVPTRDARCSTAMTDGKNIFFDIDFLSRLKADEVQFVLGHEIWHVVMLHFVRGEGKDHTQFNIATDMEVNQILETDGFTPPKDALFPNKGHNRNCEFDFPNGLSAEEYYELLIKRATNRKNEDQDQSEDDPKQDSKGNGRSKKNNGLSGQFDTSTTPANTLRMPAFGKMTRSFGWHILFRTSIASASTARTSMQRGTSLKMTPFLMLSFGKTTPSSTKWRTPTSGSSPYLTVASIGLVFP